VSLHRNQKGGKGGAAARRGHNDGQSLRSSPRRGGSCDLPATLAPAPRALLREYRTRLIADVVTGKLDVREVAAKLPDEAPEAELLDEMEDLPQDEPAAEDFELEAADTL
jgi:hypothetical protein